MRPEYINIYRIPNSTICWLKSNILINLFIFNIIPAHPPFNSFPFMNYFLYRYFKKLQNHVPFLNFRYEQWPCSLKQKFFKKIYRETALMYSLSTSALTYNIAKACSSGNLENCACGSHGRSDKPSEWEWGGCSDNTRFARSFTNKFFQLKKKSGKW